MSLFSKEDYCRENKSKNHRSKSHGGIATSKKVGLPTQLKSPNHKCAFCERKDAKKYQITDKECRWLCPVCLIKIQNRDLKEKPHFIKASKLVPKGESNG